MHTALLIDGNPGDASLIQEYLGSAAPGHFVLAHCECLADGLTYLENKHVDLILLDLSLPESGGVAALRQLWANGEPLAPVIILTGLRDEALARQALKDGAQDVLVKAEIDENILLRAMNYALERHSLLRSLHARTAELERAARATVHEQALAHARQIEQIIAAVPDGVLLLDNAGNLSLANPAARTFLPLLTEAAEGERVQQLGGLSLTTLLQRPAGGVPWHEVEAGNPPRIFEIIACPLLSDSASGATVLVIRDVTEQRRRQQYLQAQERLVSVGQLATGVAHDFNNIMAIITLYSQSLERNPDLPKRLQYLRTIGEQARHAANLITQILDFSRTSVMEWHRVDLRPFVREMVRLLERTVPERVSIIFDAEPGVFHVYADPTRLQQMLMNLALNARDALPDGGHLSLALAQYSFTAAQPPPLPGLDPGAWIRLQVIDDGMGIAREDLDHIFEPYFTTKEPGQGTGLGLAQVNGIVKEHGGAIGVESRPGTGTCFSIYLPALPAEEEPVAVAGAPAGAIRTGSGECILLVEDNAGTREAIADVLEMSNYQVLSAADGEEALRQFAEHADEIDLVISDMVMPHVDGLLLYQRLREIQPAVKVVIITGYPLEERGKVLLEKGIVAWIQKPFSATEMNQVVHNALRADPEAR